MSKRRYVDSILIYYCFILYIHIYTYVTYICVYIYYINLYICMYICIIYIHTYIIFIIYVCIFAQLAHLPKLLLISGFHYSFVNGVL